MGQHKNEVPFLRTYANRGYLALGRLTELWPTQLAWRREQHARVRTRRECDKSSGEDESSPLLFSSQARPHSEGRTEGN